MTSVVVEVVYLLISHKVRIVEHEPIDAETVCQLEVIENVPLVLTIEAKLIELHTSGRGLLAIVAVCKTDNLWSSATEEVV